jgi:6-phosphogluconolactonase
MKKTSSKVLAFGACVFTALSLSGPVWAAGGVYAMTNAIGNNEVVFWQRAATGQLTYQASYLTGGGGSGIQIDPTDSLGSQGAIILDSTHQRLFVVNTETLASNSQDCQTGSITSFLVASDGSLTMAAKVSSGGLFPSSLAILGNTLYVLNAGGPGLVINCHTKPNITGFVAGSNGHLTPIPGSTESIDPGPPSGTGENCSGFGPDAVRCGLNPPAFPRSPAEVAFTPNGRDLAVTVKGTNSIYIFPLKNGVPGKPTVTQAPGPTIPTYFGFNFDSRGHLIVAEPFGRATSIPLAPASAVSSFTINGDGTLTPITVDLADNSALSCWVAIDPVTKSYAYTSNNGDGTLSAYAIGKNGSLTLLNGTAATGNGNPNDMATVQDQGKGFLYVLNAASGEVDGWRIHSNGSLTVVGNAGGLPVAAGAQGLVAY